MSSGKPPPHKGKPAPPPRTTTATDSDFEDVTANGRVPTLGEIRRITGSIPVTKATAPAAPAAAPKPATSSAVLTARPNVLARQLHHSGFDDEERTETSAILGHAPQLTLDDDEDDSQVGQVFDGVQPAPGVTAIDTWKATTPPAQSMYGRRSRQSYANVIAQFAAGHNARYAPDAKGASRAHVFVWDVSRAMGCEIPHFLAGRELNLAQTVDWLKMASPQRGWRKVKLETALEQVAMGNIAVVVPRDPKRKAIAVLRPESTGVANLRVAAAVPQKGNDLGAAEALGTLDLELYVHD